MGNCHLAVQEKTGKHRNGDCFLVFQMLDSCQMQIVRVSVLQSVHTYTDRTKQDLNRVQLYDCEPGRVPGFFLNIFWLLDHMCFPPAFLLVGHGSLPQKLYQFISVVSKSEKRMWIEGWDDVYWSSGDKFHWYIRFFLLLLQNRMLAML